MDKIELVSRSLKVKINLTAADWQLYDIPGADKAAEGINRRLEQVLLDCTGDWYSRAMACLKPAEKWGATDTEGYAVLDLVLERFGLMEPA